MRACMSGPSTFVSLNSRLESNKEEEEEEETLGLADYPQADMLGG